MNTDPTLGCGPRKLYVEPTSACNLACTTCMRRTWSQEDGDMAWETFAALVDDLDAFAAPATIALAGIGEPLLHPRIVDMVAVAHQRGHRVEMTTNAVLLEAPLAGELRAVGLDQLVVSIDGATEESFARVRPGASLEQVVTNVRGLRDRRGPSYSPSLRIGIEFVAMRSTIGDLPALAGLGRRLGASFVIVSNVLPHSEELVAETLYDRGATAARNRGSTWAQHWSLPRMDIDDLTAAPLLEVLRSVPRVDLLDLDSTSRNEHCPFVHDDALAVRWDGAVSTCPTLMHTHTVFVMGREKTMSAHIVGRLGERSLTEIWRDPDYVAFRRRVREFEFPPCTDCGGCDLAEGNQEDCFGNPAPVCGDCLWARGIVRCP